MAWDSDRRQIYFTGSGHGLDCKTIQYNDFSNTWTDLGRPSWFTPNVQSARHGYQHNAYANGIHYSCDYGTNNLRTRNPDTNIWSTVSGGNLTFLGGGGSASALEFFPTYNGGNLVFVQGDAANGIRRWSGSSWIHVASPAMGPYHNVAVYSPIRNILYFGGGNGSARVYMMNSAGTITACAVCPANIGIMASVTTVDPTTGNLIAITKDKVVRVYDPDLDQWSTDTAPNANFWSATVYSEGDLQAISACQIPDYGVTLFITIGPSGQSNEPAIYLRKGR